MLDHRCSCRWLIMHSILKRRLSSGKRWKIICEHYSFLLCKCGRTSVKTCSLKSMALQMPSYSKYACNIVKIGGRLFTPRVRVVPYTSFCASVCNFTKTWPNFLSFNDSRTLQYTQILICYMINLFWSVPHRFFHNAIAWPELDFIFKVLFKNAYRTPYPNSHNASFP